MRESGQTPLSTDHVNAQPGPRVSGTGDAAGASSWVSGAGISNFSIVSVYNNHTRYNPLPLSYNPLPLSSTMKGQSDGSIRNDTHHQCSRRRSRFKDAPIPTFNGDRLKWAEFRTIWSRYGAEEMDNDIDRAYALQQSLKGEALKLVEAITANQHNAYANMWHKLDVVYSDVSRVSSMHTISWKS